MPTHYSKTVAKTACQDLLDQKDQGYCLSCCDTVREHAWSQHVSGSAQTCFPSCTCSGWEEWGRRKVCGLPPTSCEQFGYTSFCHMLHPLSHMKASQRGCSSVFTSSLQAKGLAARYERVLWLSRCMIWCQASAALNSYLDQHPSWCCWDAGQTQLGMVVSSIARLTAREFRLAASPEVELAWLALSSSSACLCGRCIPAC